MKRDVSGKTFEKLVAQIEQAIGQTHGRKVEFDKTLRHLLTNAPRQFDVVVTFEHGHHQTVTAIECKDHRRPVGVEVIESLKSKIDGCPVDKGLLISASGYTKDALVLAEKLKIKLLTLREAERFDWIDLGAVLIEENQEIERIDVSLFGGNPELHAELEKALSEGAKLVHEAGEELSGERFSASARHYVDWDRVRGAGGSAVITVIFDPAEAMLLHPGGKMVAVRRIEMAVSARAKQEVKSLSFHSYSSANESTPIVSTSLNISGVPMKFLLVRGDDGQIRFSLAPDPRPSRELPKG